VSHTRTFRRATVVAAAAILLASCGGGGGDGSSTAATSGASDPGPDTTTRGSEPASTATGTAPSVADVEVDLDALDAQLADLIDLSAEEQEAHLATLDAELERELWTLSGLEDALGGPEAADAAFAAHSEAIVSRARAIVGEPIVMSGLRAPLAAPGGPNIGMGLFGGIMVVSLGAEAIVSATNDFKDGQTASGALQNDTTISGSLDHVEMNVDTSHEGEGVTTKLRIKITVDPCPDPTGHFEGTAKIDISATTTGGSTGQTGTLDVTVTGQVDDDANLASTEADYRMQWADFSGGKGSFVDVSGAIGDTKVVGATLNRSGGTPNATLQQSAAGIGSLFAYMIEQKVAEAAQKGWQSGRCVTLQPTAAPGPTGLKPSSTSTISAAPRSRIDGAAVGGTVTATLSAGGAAVEPAGTKVPADATFTYAASDEVNQTGTVSLEARSKRGVAKASIDFDTAASFAYSITGGLEDFQVVDQQVCDVRGPFELVAPGAGTAVFSGGESLSGTYTATGVFNFSYSGTYAITLPDGPGKPGTMSGTSAGQIAGEAGSGTETYVLTPLEPCA
jgi:hypothetical protein